MPDEDPLKNSSPPGGIGASAQDVLEAMLPLVVKAASDSAASSTAAAASVGSFEAQLAELRTSVDANTIATDRWAAAKETENKLQAKKIRGSDTKNKRWHETMRAWITPQLLIQVIFIVATGFGIVSQIPVAPQSLVTQPSPGTMTGGGQVTPAPQQHP